MWGAEGGYPCICARIVQLNFDWGEDKIMPYNSKVHDYSIITASDNDSTDSCKAGIIPINQLRNVPLDSVTQYGNDRLRKSESQRHYTAAKVINNLAVKKYKINGRGISFNDLLFAKIATSKKQAQIKLKYHLKKKTLFTISKNKPQSYYPESLRSEIINNKISKNIPIGITGVPYNNNTHWFAAGLMCLWNFRSCGRYHCAITGPGFLGIGILSLAEALGTINLQEWIEWSVFLAILAIGFGLEYAYKLREGTCYCKTQ
jgi:hypothetical protein